MAKNGKTFDIIRFVGKLIDDRIMYKNLKADPDARKITTSFGWSAILYSVFFSLLAVLGSFLVIKGATAKGLGFLLGVFAIIIGVVFLLVALELFVFALSHTIKQITLNRRAISFVALTVFVIGLAAAVLAVFAIAGVL